MIDPEDEFAHTCRQPEPLAIEGEAVLTLCGRIRPYTEEGTSKPHCQTCETLLSGMSEYDTPQEVT